MATTNTIIAIILSLFYRDQHELAHKESNYALEHIQDSALTSKSLSLQRQISRKPTSPKLSVLLFA